MVRSISMRLRGATLRGSQALALALMSVVVACGSGSSSSVSGPPGGGTSDGGTGADAGGEGSAPTVRSTHFEEAGRRWRVDGAAALAYIDVNGDGWIDGLRSESDRQAFGTSDADAHWNVFRNDRKAFALTPFAVPRLALWTLGIRGSNQEVVFGDFDGDRRPDLFDRVAGTLARGTDAGLAPDQPWNVASLGPWDAEISDQFFDFDGDGKNDVALMRRHYPTDANGSYLEIARNTGAGFGPREHWAVPQATEGGPLDSYAMDFDGDRRTDLVHFVQPANGYDVWHNNGAGFDAPQRYAFPAGCYCMDKDQHQKHKLVDIDGDGRVDLVEPADARTYDGGTGLRYLDVWGLAARAPYWKVYPNVGTSFAAEAVQWRVPMRGGVFATNEGFNGVDDPHSAPVPQNRAYFTIDFDGDGRLDLVDFERDRNSLTDGVTVHFGVP